MTLEERRVRLKEWLDCISEGVTEAVVNQHIFWEVQGLIRSNPYLQNSSSEFFEWMASTFAHSSALAVRRQLDIKRPSISLCRFLLELQKFPDLISRQYHCTLYAPSGEAIETANKIKMANYTYDRLVGEEAIVLNIDAIRQEIESLRMASERIHHFADRVIAHYDQRGLEQSTPKFDDLDECLAVLEKLVLRYRLLLNGAFQATLLPTFMYDWKSVFRVAWIPSG
jgi:hypothetical protein